MACASFEDVFAAVEGGPGTEPSADLAMIPIDNSIAGRVADIHHFLPDSGLHIVAEHFLRIRFQLLGIPGARIDQIRTVHSHVHALGQCRKAIRAHNLVPSTPATPPAPPARSSRRATRPRPPTPPPLAAEIYGLDALADDVEDEDHNTTRFVVLSRELVEAPGRQRPGCDVVHLQCAQPACRA